MRHQLTHITLTGSSVGAIWWPIDEECRQEFAMDFMPPAPDGLHKSPYAEEWPGIREALMACATSGDFVGGRGDVEEAWITFHYAGEGESITRTRALHPTRATQDLFQPVLRAEVA